MADINQILAQWQQKHGGLVGEPFATNPTIKSTNPRTGETSEDPNFDPVYRYSFADGSTLEMNGSGQIKKADEKSPSANSNRPNYRTAKVNGVTYESWDGHPWSPAEGLPAEPTAPSRQTPSDPSKWQPIRENPNDPNSRIVALQDPVTGDRQTITQPGQDRNATAGSKKQTIENGRAITWVADGQGNWTIDSIGQPIPNANQPTNGQTRRVLSGDYVVTETYQNGVWSVDPSTPATRFVPTDKPNEGDVRPNVKDGQAIQEVYRGGQWVIDPTVPPKPYGPQTPTNVSAPAGQQFIVQQTPGQVGVSTIENPNYIAQDAAGRLEQLRGAALKKRDELNAQIASGQKTKDQAAAEFDAWWATSIEPYKQQLTQQQAVATAAQQREEQTAERANLTTAQQAGRDAAEAVKATLPYRVGPGFGTAVNQIAQSYSSGKAPGNIDIGSAVTFDMPDLQDISRKATADALAHLSPTAAGIAGRQPPAIPQVDIAGMLNQSQYQPGTTTIAPDGTVTIQHAQPQQPQPFAQSGLPEGRSLRPVLPPLAPNEQQIFGNYTYPG